MNRFVSLLPVLSVSGMMDDEVLSLISGKDFDVIVVITEPFDCFLEEAPEGRGCTYSPPIDDVTDSLA